MVNPTNKFELVNTYFHEAHEDAHRVYAERAGITREQAKLEVYRYIFSHPFLKRVQIASKEAAEEAMFRRLHKYTVNSYPHLKGVHGSSARR